MGRLRTAATGIFLATGGFLFGYDSGIISSTIAQPRFIAYMGSPSAAERGGIVSSFTGGAILGSISVSVLADRFGRKRTVQIGSLISTIGCTLQGGAANIPMMIIGRLIAGFSVGLLAATVPMYCSEIAIAKDRGKLAGLLQWLLSWGFFIAQWLGYGCFQVNSDFQWRFPLCFQLVPSLILLIGSLTFLVESPRWLMEKNRFDEARAILTKLHSTGDNQEFLDLEYREIRDTIVAEKSVRVNSWRALISKPSWRRRLVLGCGVQAFGQLSGINVINYFGPQIYALLGIQTGTALKIIGINGTLGLVETGAGLFILDKVGRVKPLIFSSLGMFATLLIEAVLAKYYVEGRDVNTSSVTGSAGTPLRAMIAMQFVFSLSFQMIGIISWVYPSEIFPVEIRARGNSISATTNWCLNLVFAQCAPIALQAISFNFFFFFSAWNFVAAICYYFFYPETKGRTLEQLDELFGDQLVPHALLDSAAAERHMSITHAEDPLFADSEKVMSEIVTIKSDV